MDFVFGQAKGDVVQCTAPPFILCSLSWRVIDEKGPINRALRPTHHVSCFTCKDEEPYINCSCTMHALVLDAPQSKA